MKPIRTLVLAFVMSSIATATWADDVIRIAIGQRGVYENCISEIGQDRGFFKKYGLTLEILYTQGGGETIQASWEQSQSIGFRLFAAAGPMSANCCMMAIQPRVWVMRRSATSMRSKVTSTSGSFVGPRLPIPRVSWKALESSCAM